ncbi:hypothetical protein FF100_07450 [Methylobacterium terricola]|uniref:Uncharacterized protein n=1 Tax=Methylobacterium terricola TaxID=2583531 RepID=A0A5C4LJT0_9HYPH|nr:hypothetical protein [Methylobacterium terricola]TNC14022.1 hypothetical protein FF100_07450 [Methylobacterium terricola]
MADALSATLMKSGVGEAMKITSTSISFGIRWIKRYFSHTILIAGQNSSGKTSFRDYLLTGLLPPHARQMEETQDFSSRLASISFHNGTKLFSNITFWIRDSRGFFDAKPIAKDIKDQKPAFLYFVFDIRRIVEEPQISAGLFDENALDKYGDTARWSRMLGVRIEEIIPHASTAKSKLCGVAILLNKCDKIDAATMESKVKYFKNSILPYFVALHPKLGVGETNIDVFRTALLKGKKLPSGEDSEHLLALEFMFQCLSQGGAIND